MITLVGSTSITLEAYVQTYFEPGYTAYDTYDGYLTTKVVVSAAPNNTVLGVFTITYSVSDAAGNQAVVQMRTVTVRDTTPPVLVCYITVTNVSS